MVKKYRNAILYGKRSFIVIMKMMLIYNSTERGNMELTFPIFVRNFWSNVKVLSVKALTKDIIVPPQYMVSIDINKEVNGAVKLIENVPDYGFNHRAIVFELRNGRYRRKYILQITLQVEASYVDGASIDFSKCGTIEDAKKELGKDYAVYVAETYYWDYRNPIVQRVLRKIRHGVESTYGKPLNKISVYLIVKYMLTWLAYHTYYMEREDYPYFRLKASQILNRTIEVEGKKKYYGVCRHITDLFVALMRGLGVPANRYEGFIITIFNGKPYLAGFHAWAEVYLPRIGWTPLEVTLTSPFLKDVFSLGDLEYNYYIPMIHEYNAVFKKPPPVIATFLDVIVHYSNETKTGIQPATRRETMVFIPYMGWISIKDTLIIIAFIILLVDVIYLHRKLKRIVEYERS